MLTSYYFRVPKRIRLLIFLLIIFLVAFFIIRFLSAETKTVPPDFLKARQQASLIAGDIVGLSNDSANHIDEIARFDEQKNYSQALTLVSQELDRNREVRQKAVDLSVELETMAKNITDIKPLSSGQQALEAVSSETTLISRLITYNDYLTQLLDVLRRKFSGKSDGNTVPVLVNKLNNEAKAINDLNQGFNDKMKVFDSQQ